jgi:hypothetical protein
MPRPSPQENITLRLSREIIRKAKVLAAKESTSVSKLLTRYVQRVVDEEEAYGAARTRALALLDKGLHLGGHTRVTRDALHER